MPQIQEFPVETAIQEFPIENKIQEFPIQNKPIQEFPVETKSTVPQSIISYIKEHPFKTILQPLPKTLGGKSPKEKLMEKFERKPNGERWTPAFLRSFTAGVTGDIADILTSPISYIPLPIGKTIGKIPYKGTTIGKVAKTIPIGKGFMRNIAELGRYEQTLKTMANRIPQTIAQQLGLEPINSIQKITQVLKEAKPIRAMQEILYTTERTKRAGAIVEAGQRIPGEAGYFAQLKALKGELPKMQFEGIRGKITQSDIDSLFNVVEKNGILSPYEKITTKTGLAKLLGAEGGVVPTEGELKLLGQVFSPDFIKTVLSKRPLIQKIFQGVEETLNVPRAIMASADMSAPLRQGLFLIGRPKQWLPAFRDMFKYAFNEKSYQGLMEDIVKRPSYPLIKESGLSLTNIGKSLLDREEKFMSNLAERIPVLGHIVRGSNRAYTGFLNKLRVDVFDDMINTAQKQGIKIEGKVLKDIGNFISTATGRGKLPGAIERSAVALNTVFFSPRLMFSRLNLLNPTYYVRLHPFVRKEALKSLLTLSGTATSIITLAKMGGANVGTDPRSADFGKIKVGNTRYDILGGFQQYIRLATQLITGEHISSTTGVKTTVGEGYKPLTRTDILGRFLETKEAPVVSFALGLLRGQTVLGKDFNIAQEAGQRFIPMVAQDMYDLYKERGLEGIGMGTPAIFGAGLQTYSPSPTEIVYSAKSVIKHAKDLIEQGRNEEAKKLVIRNVDLIKKAKKLDPLQEELSKYEKARKIIIQNIKFTSEQKKKGITYTEMMIKKFGKKMEERYKEIK